VSSEPTEVFGPLAEEYARYRPSYPGALFDVLLGRLGRRHGPVLDLGSGTGSAIAPLLEAGARVLAVEPNLAMLARACRRFGAHERWIGAVAAPAERLPIASGRLPCVVVAQAFHWFDPAEALDEIARALAPGGMLAVLWNVTAADEFTEEVTDLIARYNPGFGRPVTRSMLATPAALASHAAFSVETPMEFPHERPIGEDAYVGYAFSWSYCGGALRSADRAPFEAELRTAIRRHHPSGEWSERLIAVAHFARLERSVGG
jgi:SAM-dependent methyltransferase